MNEPDLRIAVLGPGRRGRIARYAHCPGKGSRVVAVCDTDPGVFETCRTDYGTEVRTETDWRTLLQAGGFDAVMVCTPDHYHEEQACAALEAGFDVFCEKPLAITVEGCDRILATAARTGRKLFVGHNMRYMDFTRTMKQIIDAGTIGEVKSIWCRHFVSYGGDAYYRDWHAERRNTTGLLLQKGTHDIDIIHWLAGAPTVRVTAFGALSVYGQAGKRTSGVPGKALFDPVNHWPPSDVTDLNPLMDVEDQSMVLMQLANGVLASYEQCHFSPDAWRNYTVIGTKGRIENQGDYSGNARVEVYTRRNDRYAQPDVVYRIPEQDASAHGGSDARMMEDFLRYLKTGGPTWASPTASRNSVAAGVMATDSLRHGGEPRTVLVTDE